MFWLQHKDLQKKNEKEKEKKKPVIINSPKKVPTMNVLGGKTIDVPALWHCKDLQKKFTVSHLKFTKKGNQNKFIYSTSTKSIGKQS